MNSFWAIWCRAATFATERRDLDMWGRIAATSTWISFWVYKVVPTIIYNVLPSLKCGWWGQASACKWVGSRVGCAKSPFRTIQISSKIYKILKTVEFFNMWLFISEIKNLNFCICQNTHFCCSGLGQVSSWWINSIFCVGKVSIWRCLFMLTFSGLHFLFYKYPMNFQQGLVQPPVD